MGHRHPLITFLSFLVNARCILLIQTTVFITGNGLRARKRRTDEESGGREGGREGDNGKKEEHSLMKN